ncbi:MAG: hypothetical protein M3121_02495 [Chloroflexota bacterium]|nr:hypothetical protein [Chloroflexota bacterium]
MNTTRPTALAATLHDPEGGLGQLLSGAAERFGAYSSMHVIATAATDPKVVAALSAFGAQVSADGDERAGENRRRAVMNAVSTGAAGCLYCDFDRWLHWAHYFREELTTLPAKIAELRPAPWYVCLGRTPRAFATHPLVQRVTEEATNHALGLALHQQIDATAGACWLSPEGAEIVLRDSIEPTNATDLEWPALVYRAAPDRLDSLACEGLEFETADRYEAEIAAAGGLSEWTEQVYDRAEDWHERLRLSADSVAALCRVLGR